MASSTSAHANGILDMLDSKGPTTETERVYRKIKSLHKQLLSLCAATDRKPGVTDDEQIVISEQPLTFGRPPGEVQRRAFYAAESEIMVVAQKIVRADRSTNQKMADVHQKLKALMRKVKTIIHFQHQQLRIDSSMADIQQRFGDVLMEEVLEEGIQDLAMADLYGQFSSYEATPAALELAEQTTGGAFLLVPAENGWAGAMESAKRALLLPPKFPDMSTHPLNKVAALELKTHTVTRREGIRRKTTSKGKLRLLSAPELNYMISHHATGDAYEHTPGNLQIVPVEASEGAILFSRWIRTPFNVKLRPSNFLLYAELLEANKLALPALLTGLKVLTSSLRWFMTAVQNFIQTRLRYAGGPLQLYYGYEDLMSFPRAYIQSLAENLTDQIQHRGEVTEDLEDVLREMKGLVYQTEDELLESGDSEDDEEEDDYYEDDPHQYFELDADLMHTPPENPDYHRVEEDDPPAGAEVPSAPSQLPDTRPSAPPRAALHQRERNLPDNPRIRRSSNESAHSENQSGRASPPATTASQLKGDGPTHTIQLQLQRSRQVLMSMEANPDSTRYKNQRDKVGKMLALAEKHLRDDQDVSESYEEFLIDEMERSEEACGIKDDEFDVAEKKKKKAEDEKKDLLATLPRGLGQKFSGNPADWPNFRDHFVRIVKTVDPTLAVAHMTSLIDCPKLKRRMKIYSSGEQVLKDFDRDFGFNFLNCQTIINQINSLPNASNKSQEMDLILKYRHAKRSLDKNADNAKLLNVTQLIDWADKLLQTTTEDLMEILQSTEFGENGSPVEPFFSHIEKIYERSSVLTRNREARQPYRSGKTGQGQQGGHHKKGKQVEFETDQRRYGNEESDKGGCGALCSTGPQHKTFNCPLIKSGKVGLKKIRQAKLCTCCLRNSADCLQVRSRRRTGQ